MCDVAVTLRRRCTRRRNAVFPRCLRVAGPTGPRSRGTPMKAVTWHGKRDVRVDEVPDPPIEEPTDTIVRITSTGSAAPTCTCTRCSAPFMDEGDILGHEPMGIVEEVGSDVTSIKAGDRVVIPFNISLRHAASCATRGCSTQCETTQVREQGMGAALFGYTELYGQVPGGQAEFLRVPQAAVRPDQGARGPARRPLRLPVRRAADRLAGRRVRGRPRRRHRRRARPRADRRHGRADRAAPRLPR